MYPGIADRMQKEINALAPSSMKVPSPHFLSNTWLIPPFSGQNCRSPRTQILCLDRWIHPRFPLYLPTNVDLQTRVRRERSFYCLQEVFLGVFACARMRYGLRGFRGGPASGYCAALFPLFAFTFSVFLMLFSFLPFSFFSNSISFSLVSVVGECIAESCV